MTMLNIMVIKQPDLDLYKKCRKDKEIPFALRSRIINTYRRQARSSKESPALQGASVALGNPSEVVGSTPTVPTKLKKKYRAKPIKVKSSRKNAVKRNTLRVVVRWTSGGRNRPSRKKKYHFVSFPRVYHLPGSKYTNT